MILPLPARVLRAGFPLLPLLLLLAVYPQVTLATTIDGVRVRPSPERTRIVFDLSGPVEHKLFQLSNPRRLVIDVEGANMGVDTGDVDLDGTPLSGLRSAPRDDGTLRVVMDLADNVKPRSFLLKPILQYGNRLVVDLYTASQQIAPVIQKDRISRQMRDVVVAIDAGHGGDDPGAVGHGGLYEKHVVLAIALELAALLEQEPGYKALMVRDGDYYVAHRKRVNLARKDRADLFVSIHADAFRNPQAHGASVYAISERGATSEAARYLAERENRADLIGGVGSVSLDDKDDLLAGVILDLSMTYSLSASLELGDQVLKSIGGLTRLHKRQVEQAGFAVLKAPDVPSILVETGFISNPQDSKRLADKKYQRQMARAIFRGITGFMGSNPPDGSYLAWRLNGGGGELTTYKIKRGDTLSGIAQKYRVTADQLRQVNGLSNDRIMIGQLLRIPAS